jgi:hypothetical protein
MGQDRNATSRRLSLFLKNAMVLSHVGISQDRTEGKLTLSQNILVNGHT